MKAPIEDIDDVCSLAQETLARQPDTKEVRLCYDVLRRVRVWLAKKRKEARLRRPAAKP